MKVKLSLKIFFIVAAMVILASVTICAISVFTYKQNFTNEIDDVVKTAGRGGELLLQNWEQTLAAEAKTVAGLNRTTSALANGDVDLMENVVNSQRGALDSDYLLIADRDGIIQAGTIGVGQSVKDVEAWQNVISGEDLSYSWIETEFVSWGLFYAAPIRYQGEVVGAVLTGYDFVKEDFVNMIREAHGTECTVFRGDLRVSTTLRDTKGNPMTGTRIDNKQVLNTVLGNGETLRLNNVIGGKKYRSIYIPHKNPDGQVVGMLFMAKNQHVITEATEQTLKIVIPSLIILLIVIAILTTLVVRIAIVKPVLSVRDSLLRISSGNADLTQRIQSKSKDEVGEVVGGFNKFVERLQSIVKIIKEQDKDLEAGGENMGAISQDTASAITEIIANIDSIHKQIETQGQSVNQTAGAVNQISSNIDSLNKMIEGQSAGITQASAAVEEMIGNISSVNQNVERMANSFEELNQNADIGFKKQQDVNEKIQQIETQSAMLEDANQAIANIAAQTNLLAMNAAIEAAHAGDAGKGFSVVADEIRKLSETSTGQSKTIGEQLAKIKESISSVVSASDESAQALTVVADKIRDTDQLVIQIRTAMEEQTEGSRQISEALKNMNDGSMEVRNASEEMTEGNKLILNEVRLLQDATLAMKGSMEEMAQGAEKINETGSALNDVTSTLKESIYKIGQEINNFTV
ncbi:MAG: methyl-accepting chemotaxis protein [Treponema sp.]|nr:methyl-accepting chemotaxis protein [Treponema sp.]